MKVLYVLASARSGNTVLGRLLGELDGFFLAGEVRFLWERALANRRCGCGDPVQACELWGEVLRELARDGATPAKVVHWQRQATRLHHTPRIVSFRPARRSGWEPLDRYAAAIRRVYGTLSNLTGAEVIVDTSQRPSNGAAIRLLPDVESYFLHVVRDPRGVVFSRQRAKANPDRDVPGILRGRSVLRDVVYWTATNLAAHLVSRRVPPDRAQLLRYEDFVAKPRATVDGLVDFLGADIKGSPFLDDRTAMLGINHTVSGNPDRFTIGKIEIRLDDRWLQELGGRERTLVAATTLPLMLRYGYQLRPFRQRAP